MLSVTLRRKDYFYNYNPVIIDYSGQFGYIYYYRHFYLIIKGVLHPNMVEILNKMPFYFDLTLLLKNIF